ncbi:MAG: hypothetical protein RL199_1141 [Pseudomonadota bacterium]|jgi:hypothetical protein
MRHRPVAAALGLLAACAASTQTAPLNGPSATTLAAVDTTTLGRTVPAGATTCGDAGALCLGASGGCTPGGGTPLPQFDKECAFDDGPGSCCLPPAPKASGDSCRDHGGLCAPVGGCLRGGVDGLFAPAACGAPPMVCCVPASECPGPRPVCCDATATYRASCDRGSWRCPSAGMRLESDGSCE